MSARCFISVVLLILAGFFVTASAQTYIYFDAPGAGTGFVQGTMPEALNDAGQIAGSYSDSNSVSHGFLRENDGTITTFDAPGAGTAANQGTLSRAINRAGWVAGMVLDSSNNLQGFLRKANGKIIAFDFPGAISTGAAGIDGHGQVVGGYGDANGFHGYQRKTDGTFLSFDVPGGSDTAPKGVNSAGQIVGFYQGSDKQSHGFLRNVDGSFVTFDPQGSVNTTPLAISAAGEIAGSFDPSSQAKAKLGPDGAAGFCFGQPVSGFLRLRDGTMTTFDVPGSLVTGPSGIDQAGNIAGSYLDGGCASHGFLLEP